MKELDLFAEAELEQKKAEKTVTEEVVKVSIFEKEEFGSVRTIKKDGEFFFCGSDVAKSLGYANSSKALNDHCKGITKCYILTNGGKQQLSFIPEGDVYRLIVHSKLESAQRFEYWVFDEVLPSIRKNGVSIDSPVDTGEKTVTTKELAEILGVEARTVQLTVQRLESANILSHLKTKSVRGGQTYAFTESQATVIKQEIQKHHNLATRRIDSVTTEEEENQTILNALTILKRRSDEYKHRAEIAESKVLELTPDADYGKVIQVDEDSYFTMDKVASHLGLPYGRNTLLHNLRFIKVLKEDNQPYEHYKQLGITSTVKQNNSRNFTVPLANAKGEKIILKRLTESDLLDKKAVGF